MKTTEKILTAKEKIKLEQIKKTKVSRKPKGLWVMFKKNK